jgi:hypothetical protein
MVEQRMVKLIAPTDCAQVVHGRDLYDVVGGYITVPHFVANELLTKGNHRFKLAPVEAPAEQPQRKVLSLIHGHR